MSGHVFVSNAKPGDHGRAARPGGSGTAPDSHRVAYPGSPAGFRALAQFFFVFLPVVGARRYNQVAPHIGQVGTASLPKRTRG